jgi:hypothetical protein
MNVAVDLGGLQKRFEAPSAEKVRSARGGTFYAVGFKVVVSMLRVKVPQATLTMLEFLS